MRQLRSKTGYKRQRKAWSGVALGVQALIFSALLLRSQQSFATPADLPEVTFRAMVTADQDPDEPSHIHGEMRVKNWRPNGGYCLYLPYADPDYGEDRGTSRRFEVLSAKAPAAVFRNGSMAVTLQPPAKAEPFPLAQVLPVNLPAAWTVGDELVLNFDSTVPRLPKTSNRQWFYDGFMPELLSTCPPAGLDPVYYRQQLTAHYVGTVTLPKNWQYAGPGHVADETVVSFDQNSHELAFALGHDYQRKDFEASGVHVAMLYHSPNFKELEATVSETLPVMISLLGPFPFPSLTIVETSELQRHGLPGIIAMNRPAQAIFNAVQQSILNWEHWIFAIQLARQWYGGAISASSPDDEWLIAGIVDFITLEALSRHPARFNLFNSANAFRILSFDYLQIAEMSAALLRRSVPYAVLTTPEFVTKDPVAEQYPMLFTKHTFAMRQLKGFTGDQAFFGFLRTLTNNFMGKTLSPAEFHAALGRLPSPFSPTVRDQLDTDLTRWWTSDGWPDFALKDASYEALPDGRWVSHLSATQEGEVDFPPLFGVKDASQRLYIARGEKPRGQPAGPWAATIVTPNEPTDEAVDPIHETFDADRFNNRLGLADWSFFPGGADTLRDDAYTVLWLPYAFRRPGEPFSLGIQSALFRYINSDLIARVETAPGTKMGAVAITDSFQVPAYALGIGLGLSQNYDHDRLAEATFSRAPLFEAFPYFNMDFALRRRERAGEPQTNHATFAIGATLHPVGFTRICGYNLGVEYEKAPGVFAAGFNYDRRYAVAAGDCNITNRSSVSARFFRGDVTGQGDLPQVATFKPTDLREAHLRLDSVGTWAKSIETMNLDVYLPFFLPLPDDSLVLTRQMRWRLFYDLGRSWDPWLTYRSAGFGFLLPFGGDLSGAGSLALTRLTLLVIAYDNVGGVISRKPSVLLDLTGDL